MGLLHRLVPGGCGRNTMAATQWQHTKASTTSGSSVRVEANAGRCIPRQEIAWPWALDIKKWSYSVVRSPTVTL